MSRGARVSSNDSTLDLRRYMGLLQTNTTLFCIIVVCCTICGLIMSYALKKKYEASSTVFIEQNVISDLVKGIAFTPSIEAKLRILKVSLLSRATLLNVARELDLDLNAKTPAQEEELIESFRSQVDIKQDERKGLFFITFTGLNPVLARDFVNTITRQYIEESTASKRKESFEATSFLAEQIKVFQGRIEEAQKEIDSFKGEKGMYLGLNEQLLREQIRDLEQRLEVIRIQKTERIAKVQMHDTGSKLAGQLEQKEMALQSLLAAYTERHPAVMRAREDIKASRRVLEQEQQKTEDAGAKNIEYQTALVELRSLEEMEANLRASIEKSMNDLQELPAIRTELAAFEQRKNNETIIYEQLVSRFGQSEVSKQMELQDKAVNFKIIDPAVLPTTHVSPHRSLIILGSIVAGMALGMGVLLAQELLRSKIRSRKDLDLYGVMVLATLPRITSDGITQQHKRQWKFAAATIGFVLMACAVAVVEFLHLPYVESLLTRLHLLS